MMMHHPLTKLATWGLCAWLMAVVPAYAQQDQPTLDELLNLTPVPPHRQDVTDQAEPPALDPAVEQMLDGATPADALEQALRQMDEVADRLGRDRDPGLDTQRRQESILARLDQVIAAAREQQSSSSSSSSSSSGASSSRPQEAGSEQLAGQTSPAPGSAGSPGAEDASSDASTRPSAGGASAGSPREGQQADRPLEELRSEWGGLPPRLRDELTQGLSEPFSPIYRDLTEAYYRRLAEQP